MTYIDFLVIGLYILISIITLYVKKKIEKAIESTYDIKIEKLKHELEELRAKSSLYANKVVTAFDEVLTIVGIFKTAGFAQLNDYPLIENAESFNKYIVRLELIGQTYWPYFTNEIRKSIYDFRKKVQESRVYNIEDNTTSFDVGHFLESADNLQELIRKELEIRFS